MKKNIIIILSVLLAAILLRFVFSEFNQFTSSKAARNAPPPQVAIEEIGEKEIVRSFEAPGRVISKYQVNVLARIAGYLQKSYFKEGDYVKQGQVLFLIEPTEYINAANVAKANADNYHAQLVYAEKQLARAVELVAKDYISKAQYDNLLSQRDALKAAYASAQAQYSDAQRNLGYTNVKAPVDGRIGIITVTVGNYVAPSSGSLTTINSTNPIYVTFPLGIEDFTALADADKQNNKHRKIELILPGGVMYDKVGIQDFQDNKIDQSTGTVTMRATFENPNNELIHGEFVTVKLYTNSSVKVPVVPQIAVQENQAGKFVYKVGEDNVPELTYVKLGRQEGDYWIVEEGLQKGDKIIIDGIQKVIPGRAVAALSAEEMAELRKEHDKADKATSSDMESTEKQDGKKVNTDKE